MSAAFTVTRDGPDLIYSGTATCFGGPGDTQDNGVGAWGFPYRQWAGSLCYCALPVRGAVPSLNTSPLPAGVPHFQPVHVYNDASKTATWCTYVDYGPMGNLSSGACIDLGPAVVHAIDPTYKGSVDTWSGQVHVRLPGLGHLLG